MLKTLTKKTLINDNKGFSVEILSPEGSLIKKDGITVQIINRMEFSYDPPIETPY